MEFGTERAVLDVSAVSAAFDVVARGGRYTVNQRNQVAIRIESRVVDGAATAANDVALLTAVEDARIRNELERIGRGAATDLQPGLTVCAARAILHQDLILMAHAGRN